VAARQRAERSRAEALAQQTESARVAEQMERAAKERMRELEHGLRMQASAEAAEAWAVYKADSRSASEQNAESRSVIEEHRQKAWPLRKRRGTGASH